MPRWQRPWQGLACIAGGFVMHLTLGTIYTFGNVTSYLTSYLHVRVSEDVDYATTMWIPALMNMGQGLTLAVGGRLYGRFGPRVACLIGCAVLTVSTALSSQTVRSSVALLSLTYGLGGGIGVGLAYVAPMSSAMKWYPERRGLANGIIVAGFGMGAVVFNWIQTSYLNPDNVAVAADNYFHESSVLDRVPSMFLLLATVYGVMQLPSIAFIQDPKEQRRRRSDSTALLDDSDEPSALNVGSTEYESTEDEGAVSLSLSEALRTRQFYQLYVTFLFNTITIGFINPLWKAYGQKNIADDHFLAFVGSAAAVFNSLGRVMWGALCDRTSYRTAMLCACTLLCAAFATMQLTPLGGRWMFAVWVWLVFVSFSANFCLIVTAVANTYGTQHAGPIYGVIFSSSVIGSPISVGLANVFLQKLGFPVMFMIQASFVCVSIIVTLTFRDKRLTHRHLPDRRSHSS
ncbi:uncharacterized MFS-type transporter YhjX-like [Amphibalanus amphitrite]|uniref:uncharacterized MFS-type transporter YhjX-like n=1 Tax=Amphibalanus amphitrite TaxID=1232801 RepID=UPI001C90891E|nr:uncharacterized MFS-type transporter YhjX-like [Amphibalanus amphitrite]XP_043247314.1 uncharacterized MFS-type transporter YhjX-like [Amphibalanus amphitrite]